ncbi:PsiF family protein [Pseudoxanthomonas winnipegensis]|uniref:Starvation-inducible protein n=1 Tax=Pseudoxanthomonas winnipegensis TaxID=2480810 RepID=A0A4V2HFP1_9GAMM|nr:PsiF family protein [Pseudoxanthomonas winnipegensis]RZZ82350.1 starvation-inducible protein [Pseudoxanthomonas winnipegensis]TAA25275.1 starvation-inducible protein [Pseudoxanthomonas winnipegensis]TAA38558.1 starvation-inducible protein [Pseudoxanthomonas winnipegensis]TAA39533.1 starvation-inducible protein [Pseudoxanthomonas winnipegensis]TBV74261.1 starvation-inducible protein [Pseudoxanthomonas winnipegensis]
MTRSILLACALLAGAVSANALAAQSSSQTRMAECSAQNKGKKGEEYKAAQKACLSAKPAAAATPQERMKSCNADASAKKLAGDARKTFMSSCLKKS